MGGCYQGRRRKCGLKREMTALGPFAPFRANAAIWLLSEAKRTLNGFRRLEARQVAGFKSPNASLGPSRHFAATQQFGRFRSEADIERFSVCTEPVALLAASPMPQPTPS